MKFNSDKKLAAGPLQMALLGLGVYEVPIQPVVILSDNKPMKSVSCRETYVPTTVTQLCSKANEEVRYQL